MTIFTLNLNPYYFWRKNICIFSIYSCVGHLYDHLVM